METSKKFRKLLKKVETPSPVLEKENATESCPSLGNHSTQRSRVSSLFKKATKLSREHGAEFVIFYRFPNKKYWSCGIKAIDPEVDLNGGPSKNRAHKFLDEPVGVDAQKKWATDTKQLQSIRSTAIGKIHMVTCSTQTDTGSNKIQPGPSGTGIMLGTIESLLPTGPNESTTQTASSRTPKSGVNVYSPKAGSSGILPKRTLIGTPGPVRESPVASTPFKAVARLLRANRSETSGATSTQAITAGSTITPASVAESIIRPTASLQSTSTEPGKHKTFYVLCPKPGAPGAPHPAHILPGNIHPSATHPTATPNIIVIDGQVFPVIKIK